MPAPTVATYSAAALVAAQTSLRNLIDAGSGPGKLRIRTSADALLGETILTDPCGTVSNTTGQLTLTVATNIAAASAGTAAYGEFVDSANVVHLSLPCEVGTAAVSGKLVLNSLVIAAGGPIDVLSAVIG